MFTRVSEEITENSERLGRQARTGIEPGTSCLSVLGAEPLRHWWGLKIRKNTSPTWVLNT